MLNFVTGFWALTILLFLIGFLVQTVIVQSVLSDSVDQSKLDQIFGFYFTLGFTIASFSSAIFGYIVARAHLTKIPMENQNEMLLEI